MAIHDIYKKLEEFQEKFALDSIINFCRIKVVIGGWQVTGCSTKSITPTSLP